MGNSVQGNQTMTIGDKITGFRMPVEQSQMELLIFGNDVSLHLKTSEGKGVFISLDYVMQMANNINPEERSRNGIQWKKEVIARRDKLIEARTKEKEALALCSRCRIYPSTEHKNTCTACQSEDAMIRRMNK